MNCRRKSNLGGALVDTKMGVCFVVTDVGIFHSSATSLLKERLLLRYQKKKKSTHPSSKPLKRMVRVRQSKQPAPASASLHFDSCFLCIRPRRETQPFPHQFAGGICAVTSLPVPESRLLSGIAARFNTQSEWRPCPQICDEHGIAGMRFYIQARQPIIYSTNSECG